MQNDTLSIHLKKNRFFTSDADWNDKGNITDFFTIDFTLEELQTLRRKQVAVLKSPVVVKYVTSLYSISY